MITAEELEAARRDYRAARGWLRPTVIREEPDEREQAASPGQ